MNKYYTEECKKGLSSWSLELIKEIAEVLSEEEPERIDDLRGFLNDWFENRIAGKKVTVIAREFAKGGCQGKLIGVVRFWQSPYCENKWLIEGLQVLSRYRRTGTGQAMVEYGTKLLEENSVKQVFAHILTGNEASASLHKKIGFVKVASGTKNSWGNYREHIDEYCLVL